MALGARAFGLAVIGLIGLIGCVLPPPPPAVQPIRPSSGSGGGGGGNAPSTSAPAAPPDLVADAQPTLRKLAAAAAAGDYPTVRGLMEPEVITEAGGAVDPSDVTIARWQREGSPLPELGKAIGAGCEAQAQEPDSIVCPPWRVVEQLGATPVFVVALRRNARGQWLVYQALYAD